MKNHELRERETSLTAEVRNMRENIQTAIEEALNDAPERKFIETIEFSFNLKDIDLKNPANRVQEEIRLPAGRGKPVKIAMFAGGEMATKARAAGIDIIDPSTIEDLGGNRQQARKLANSIDFFLAEIPHMGTVGRFLGVVLGPRGKMPRPVPPNVDPGMIATGLKDTSIVPHHQRPGLPPVQVRPRRHARKLHEPVENLCRVFGSHARI